MAALLRLLPLLRVLVAGFRLRPGPTKGLRPPGIRRARACQAMNWLSDTYKAAATAVGLAPAAEPEPEGAAELAVGKTVILLHPNPPSPFE